MSNKTISYNTPVVKKKKSLRKFVSVAILLILIFVVPAYAYVHKNKVNNSVDVNHLISSKNSPKLATSNKLTPTITTVTSLCSTNTLSKLIIASISQRHLWACSGGHAIFSTPVITGDDNLIDDATPIGTYQIYAKEINLYLNGSDSRGTWHDYVNYWMPFLSNQYGVFGMHDATWRPAVDFGSTSSYSDSASHGCIEMPYSSAQWIYNWSDVGTPITVES